MWSGRCEANLVWQMWFGKCGLTNIVWQTWLGWLVGGVSRRVGGGQYEFNEFNFTGNGFLDLWSQQQHQLHESIVNRLTYGCKPVKMHKHFLGSCIINQLSYKLLRN